MKNDFDGLISRLNTSEERISEPKDRLIGISKTSMHRENWINKTE